MGLTSATSADGTRKEPLSWLLWHPHQKLWNWRLVGAVRQRLSFAPGFAQNVVRFLRFTDSVLLLVRVGARRAVAPAAWIERRPRDSDSVLYVDCGTHTHGLEVEQVYRWFAPEVRLRTIAFEAIRGQFEQAQENLSHLPDVDLRHAAVVGPGYVEPTVKLYRDPTGDGRDASVFSADTGAAGAGAAEEAPAIRLSDVLRASVADDSVVILRMNIEGAELHVIEDLVDAGLVRRIDGFYGMWDDLSKVDPGLDKRFRRLMRANHVRPITLNDRDLGFPLRLSAIRFDIETSIRRGLRRRS